MLYIIYLPVNVEALKVTVTWTDHLSNLNEGFKPTLAKSIML